jgi:hypothetical protein
MTAKLPARGKSPSPGRRASLAVRSLRDRLERLFVREPQRSGLLVILITLGLFFLIGVTQVLTAGWTDSPSGGWLSREALYLSYRIPVAETETASGGDSHSYVARTSFWSLVPPAWRSGATWQLTLPAQDRRTRVTVSGVRVPATHSASSNQTSFAISPTLIERFTPIVVRGPQKPPQLELMWQRGHVYDELPPLPRRETGLINGRPIRLRLAGSALIPCGRVPAQSLGPPRGCAPSEEVISMDQGEWAYLQPRRRPWPPQSASVSLWLRPSGPQHANVITNDDDRSEKRSVQLTLTEDGRILGFFSSDGSTYQTLTSTTPISPYGAWTMVTITIDSKEVRLYINGQPSGALQLDEAVQPTSLPILLGVDRSGRRYYYGFDGEMAGVRFVRGVLSPEQVSEQYFLDLSRPAPDGSLFSFSPTPLSLAEPYEWWRNNSLLVAGCSVVLYLLLSIAVLWSSRQIFPMLQTRLLKGVMLTVIAGFILAGAITTNFDIQLFKGHAERYWVYGPLPALTITGYGPLADLLLSLPSLPYLMLTSALGQDSEFALNLAIRLPLVIGWLLLLATSARLLQTAGSMRGDNLSRVWRNVILLNPVILVMTLWQPEALLAGLVALAVLLLVAKRPVLSGVFFGLAVAGKYWPLFAGPAFLAYAYRRRVANKWLASSFATVFVLFGAYWLPTLAKLGSWKDFLQLIQDRMPFIGQSGAESATIWSLYKYPPQLGEGLPLKSLTNAVEDYSLLAILAVIVIVTVALLQVPASLRTLALGVGGILAFVAGINTLSVPHFALWSAPFVAIATLSGRMLSGKVLAYLTACLAGALVSLFVEPISYWLLHVSSPLDEFAYEVSVWLNAYLVNVPLAEFLGFVFAVLLVVTGTLMINELARRALQTTAVAGRHRLGTAPVGIDRAARL